MIETSLAPPPVAVFEGSGTAPMPLLWAQRELWDIIQDLVPRDYVTNAGRVVEAPRRRIGIGAAATAIGHLLSRHEILRIRVVGDDDPRQEVLTRGCCEITLVETTAELARAEARPLMERLRTVRFASDRELPARFGLIVVDGLVHYVTFAASHVSADGHVLDQLARDLRMLLLGRSLPPRSGLGLADLVARQQSAGSRHTRKALAHWRDGLLRVPQTTFAARPESAEPRYRYPVLTSAAMLGAARRLAAVHRTTTSIVLLAATVGAIAELTGHGTCGLLIHVSNRFRSECATVVAPAAQMGLVVVEVGGRPEWSE
ncbi:MAG: hypothetical protein HKP61_14120, partial [Dactylosporangium sp.]|nr:hypothetical protein [Dactylosporangium sp.]NNJ62049.1 hypothetical protein [Dactylosporangium sp.]